MQPERDIVVSTDPFGRVNRAGLQRCEYLGAGQCYRRSARAPQYLSTESRDAHLEALQVLDRVDRLLEPTAHLHARVATGKRHQVERLVKFTPQLEAATVVEPAIELEVVKSERNSREELRRVHLAFVVIGCVVAHLHRTAAYGIEHFECRDQFPGAVHLDLQSPARCPVDTLGQVIDRDAETRKLRWPGSDAGPRK